MQIPAKESALPVESRDTIPMIVQCGYPCRIAMGVVWSAAL